LEPVLQEKCWKQKQLHDEYFQAAYFGVRSSAEKFKARVLSEKTSNAADLLTLVALQEKAKAVFSGDTARVGTLTNIAAETLIASESHPLLVKPILGNQDVDIAALIDKLGNSDWVKQGRAYHKQSDETCPFCQQPTNAHFASSLNAFFSDAYDDDIQLLITLLNEYKTAHGQLEITINGNIERNNTFLNTELYNAEALALSERLKRNQQLLEDKLTEPSRKITLDEIATLVTKLQDLVTEANNATNSHNQTVANIASEKQALTAQVWKYVLSELSADLSQYEQTKNKLNRTIREMEKSLRVKQQERRGLEQQVKELERQTTSVQPTIDAINNLLAAFGFNSFSIKVADNVNHYQICRDNGDDASRSLSEGEKTFITFLYFYSLIKGAQSASGISTDRVVVFDDPISSLDSDILYIVSTLIKGVIEEVRNQSGYIKQVFVLTHNVYFHKEISFHKKRSKSSAMSDESFWMVKKKQQSSIVERCDENPIRSAYELLWQDVRSSNISSPSLQNTLRRILENYFTMWGGMGKDEICELFEGSEKLICQSLFSWVNDGSHSIHDDLYINHGEQTNEVYLRVFREIFIKSEQLGHYIMMIGTETGSSSTKDIELDSETGLPKILGNIQ
jgi:wobble nucleotide-excising tRNase